MDSPIKKRVVEGIETPQIHITMKALRKKTVTSPISG
jgi:hypothetical protein